MEVNPQEGEYEAPEYELYLDDPELARITRIRLLSDPGYPFWDVSYVHGEDREGRKVRVTVDWFQIKRGPGLTKRLVALLGDRRDLCRVSDVLSLLS